MSRHLKEIWNKYADIYPREADIIRNKAFKEFTMSTDSFLGNSFQNNGKNQLHFIFIKGVLNGDQHFREFQGVVGRSDGSGEESDSKEKERAIQ